MIKIAVYPALVVSRFALVVILILFLVSSLLFIVTPRPAHAADPGECETLPSDATPQQTIDVFNKCAIKKNIFDDKVFNFNQLSGTTDSLYTMIIGNSLLHPETDEVTQGRGAVAGVGNMIAALYARPPASGVHYFASEIQKFNPVQPAYAQGIGFEALDPVKGLWEQFRNASYLGFVIIFVVMGFMIMFRAHISPQAVATVQDSLPRIVVALILVTFSYAIAGLMVDLMFLFINIVIQFLAQAEPNLITSAQKGSDIVFKKSILGLAVDSWDDVVSVAADAINNIIRDTIKLGTLGKLISFTIGGIGGLIVGIAMLFIMFRVFFMLLMSYVMVLVLTLAAPFYFLIQALPGNNGAKEWFKQMAANIAVFPAVAIMILLAGVIADIGAFGGEGLTPLQNEQVLKFPLLAGGFKEDAILKIIGLGILFMTPEVAKMIKEAIGAKGLGGGAGLGAGAAALGASAGFLGRRASESSPGQAISALSKGGGERRAEWFMGKAPSFMKPPGVKEPKLALPTFKREKD